MKTSRRTFLAASGAALVVLPGPLRAAQPRPTPTGLIDCQSHLFSADMLALMEKRTSDPVVAGLLTSITCRPKLPSAT